jgi:hypothetical protein
MLVLGGLEGVVLVAGFDGVAVSLVCRTVGKGR